MTVSEIIAQLAIIQSGIATVKKAYEFTPESAAALPCFINYPVSGSIESETGLGGCAMTHDTHVIGCDYMVSRGNLPNAEKQARPIVEAFRLAILNDLSLGGTCANALHEPITYEYAVEKFGNQEVLVVSFRLTCNVFR